MYRLSNHYLPLLNEDRVLLPKTNRISNTPICVSGSLTTPPQTRSKFDQIWM